VKHFGPEPPWRGESSTLGRWVHVPATPPSPDDWFQETTCEHWLLKPPRSGFARILETLNENYLPTLREELNRTRYLGSTRELPEHPEG
jgi:hypothetical protein